MNDRAVSARAASRDGEGAGQHAATVREMVDTAALEHPAAIAYWFPDDGREETFEQLGKLVQAGARQLLALGVQRGDTVVTVLENGPAAVHLFWATMYAGAVVVPLNPREGDSSLRARMADAAPRLIVHDAACTAAPAAAPPDARCIAVDNSSPEPWPRGAGTAAPLPELSANDEALVDYTSGTTGRPKGVVMTHGAVAATAAQHCAAQELGADDRTVLVLPLFHMSAQNATVLTGLWLGTGVAVPRGFRAGQLWTWLDRYRCTWFAAVPAILHELLHAPPGAGMPVRARFVRSSSAPLPAQLQRKFEDRFGIPVVQAMGMTEAGGTVFFNPFPPGRGRPGSVGRPRGYEVRLVNDAGAPVTDGATGYVEVRGPALMKGYRNAPELTAEVMRPGGWLRTGDLAHRDADGFFYIDGRRGERANKGGEKVDLREVATVLERHPGVREAVALAVPDAVLGEEVIAFVAPVPGSAPGERELRGHCERAFGQFMAPARIYTLDSLPRGAMGKINRDALRARVAAGTDGSAGAQLRPFVHEAMLAQLWCECLEVPRAGPDDDFFAAGGTSLAAVRFAFRVHEVFGLPLPIARLFETPRFADLSAFLERARVAATARAGAAPVCLQPGNGRDPVCLVPGGAGDEMIIYFLYRGLLPHLGPERAVYALPAPAQDIDDHADIASIAAAMLAQMDGLETGGARHLVGFCVGGLVAFEMAQQLRAAGRSPASLTLVDTAFPSPRRRWINRLRRPRALVHGHGRLFGSLLWRRLAHHAGELRRQPPGARLAYCREKLGRLGRFYRHSTRRDALNHPDPAAAREIGRRRGDYHRKLLQYRPAHWPGTLNLVVCDNPAERAQPWQSVAREARVFHTGGDHTSQLREFSDQVAAHLHECIGEPRPA